MRAVEKILFRKGDWWFWSRHKSPLSVAFNLVAISFSMACPFTRIKNAVLRLTGMKIGKNAFIAMGTALDIFYPEKIEIGENAIIGYGCVITAHELLQGEMRVGKVRLGAHSVLGARSMVLPGVEIGDGAIVGAMSLVNSDVPPKALYAGVPARRIR